MGEVGEVSLLTTELVGGGSSLVELFDTPELLASMMVDSSAESGGPGEGVCRVNAFEKKGNKTLNHKCTC